MPAISRIWARSALISAGLQTQQVKLEPGRLVSAIGLLIPQCRPGRTTKTPRLQGNLSRRSRSYGHSMGVNTPARKSALVPALTMCPGCPVDVAHRQADRRSAAGPPATDTGALIAGSSVAAVLAGARIEGASLGRDGGQAERGDDEQHQSDGGRMRCAGQGQGRNQAQDRDGRAQPERPSRPPPAPTARARARTWWLRRRARRRGQPARAGSGSAAVALAAAAGLRPGGRRRRGGVPRWRWRRDGALRRRPAVTRRPGPDAPVTSRRGPASVSYTHLRAHETVLDL